MVILTANTGKTLCFENRLDRRLGWRVASHQAVSLGGEESGRKKTRWTKKSRQLSLGGLAGGGQEA